MDRLTLCSILMGHSLGVAVLSRDEVDLGTFAKYTSDIICWIQVKSIYYLLSILYVDMIQF